MRRALAMLMTAAICEACTTPDAGPKQAAVTPTATAPKDVSSDEPPSKGSTPAPVVASGACEALSRTACMQSTECTLEQEGERSRRYRCQPATEPCERGFAQAGFWGSGTEGVRASKAQQAACDARPGCGFVDGGCYCHCRGMGETAVPDGDEAEDCDCECSGGPPPTCRAKQ